ncbi:DgyrCDS5224 [Dimorphilus gyrociliatus]|uniref:DgyrCDS5224 n=1 Tax=Dimorphilus gyrociliatus TaxID=2664684 RepID=A0A7I8VLJ6_9ANNE|nr:DgyrCDS5224 [Dimorphilus gyrociliatus]
MPDKEENSSNISNTSILVCNKFKEIESLLANCSNENQKVVLSALSNLVEKTIACFTNSSRCINGYQISSHIENGKECSVSNLSDIVTVQSDVASKIEKVSSQPSKLSKKNVQAPKSISPKLTRVPIDKVETPPNKIRKSQRLIMSNKNLNNSCVERIDEELEGKAKEEIFEIQTSYNCVLCNLVYESVEMLLDHVKSIHLVKRTKISKKITRTETDALVCRECDECFFKTKHIGIVLLDIIKHLYLKHQKELPTYVRIFYCTECCNEFLSKDDFVYHNKMSHKSTLTNVTIEKRDGHSIYKFSSNPNSISNKNHKEKVKYLTMELYKDEGPFLCAICKCMEKDDSDVDHLSLFELLAHIKENHLIVNNQRKALKCTLCVNSRQFRFHKGNALKRGMEIAYQQLIHHFIKSHKLAVPSYCFLLKCSQCSYETVSHKYLQQHERTQHKSDMMLCDLCGQKIRKCSMKSHLLSCSKKNDSSDLFEALSERAFKCDVCGLVADRKSIITRHITRMHQMKTAFKCDYCNLTFFNKQEKEMHTFKVHSVAMKDVIRCPHCDYETITKWMMKKHLLKHDTGKFFCSICKSESSTRRGLMEHMRRSHKTALNKHSCPVCPFVTQLQFRLQKHIEKKHPEKLRHCTVCSFATVSGDNLEKHYAKIHKLPINSSSTPIQDNISIVSPSEVARKSNTYIIESQLSQEPQDTYLLQNGNDKLAQAAIQAGLVPPTSKYNANNQQEIIVNLPPELSDQLSTGHEVIVLADGSCAMYLHTPQETINGEATQETFS